MSGKRSSRLMEAFDNAVIGVRNKMTSFGVMLTGGIAAAGALGSIAYVDTAPPPVQRPAYAVQTTTLIAGDSSKAFDEAAAKIDRLAAASQAYALHSADSKGLQQLANNMDWYADEALRAIFLDRRLSEAQAQKLMEKYELQGGGGYYDHVRMANIPYRDECLSQRHLISKENPTTFMTETLGQCMSQLRANVEGAGATESRFTGGEIAYVVAGAPVGGLATGLVMAGLYGGATRRNKKRAERSLN